MQERASTLSREAEERSQAIAQRVSDFAAATRAVETALLADKSKLQRYLGAAAANDRRVDHE
jgi:CHASE1-domain containing sensor protein